MNGHKKVVCKICFKTISQCRCMCCDRATEYSTCPACKAEEEEEVVMFKYHVVYQSQNTIGSVFISRNTKIRTSSDVKGTAKYISKEYCNSSNAVLVNWIELKPEQEKQNEV